MRPLFPLALLLACADAPAPSDRTPDGVAAIVDPERPEHFFDVPFPSDALLDADGHPDLADYPVWGTDLGARLVDGWRSRLEATAVGFGNHSAAYFRFQGPLDLPTETPGSPDDPVVLIDLETGALTPLVLRFVEDPQGDPFYAPNTLALAPALGHPPRSGATLAAVVLTTAGARAPAGATLPDGVQDALDRAGVTAAPAVATVFTVQDAVGQMQALAADARARLGDTPDWGDVTFRRVTRLEYRQGETPSGNEGTAQIVTFDDGSTATTWMAAQEPTADHALDLLEWPMAVYEAEITLLNYSGLDDRPYMSPGLTHINDFERTTGWIDFDGDTLRSTPELEPVRLTLSLPKGADGAALADAPVIVWDHGTGGSAYNIVARRSGADRAEEMAALFAERGVAILSRDSPLYGSRYPLIDEGYGASLGFYNIVNLPAFRDNQRQAALEGEMLRWYVEAGLADDLPDGSIDPTAVHRAGHSLGSVTSNLGLSIDPQAWRSGFLSGSGGVFTHYALDTGLLGTSIDASLVDSLFALFQADAPDELTVPAILGAALALPPEAWDHIDRLHPVLTLFQWTMDPSDPMSVAPAEQLPLDMIIGLGDYQVPDFTSYALAEALPSCEATACSALSDYDPHLCLHREDEGLAILDAWLEGAVSR